jgi:hypothetical protein
LHRGSLGTDGQCDPSHQTLADDVACCARSVRRATAALRALGLVHWQRRLLREGSCVEQVSNAYTLSIAATTPIAGPSRIGGGQVVREIQFVLNLEELTAAREALARRRQAFLTRFATEHGAKGGIEDAAGEVVP